MAMIDVSALRAEFCVKLAATGSLDAAFTKAVWLAFQAGAGADDEEPFGYFRAEPFGWTDCAETDEGAKPLYERPTPDYAALARIAELERVIRLLSRANGSEELASAYDAACAAMAKPQKGPEA